MSQPAPDCQRAGQLARLPLSLHLCPRCLSRPSRFPCRRSLSSRPSSSEVLSGSSAGDFSDDDDDEEESQSRPYPPPLAPQHDARTHR